MDFSEKCHVWLLFIVYAVSFSIVSAGCPNGWRTVSGSCYRLFANEKRTFNASQNFCHSKGGYLARDTSLTVHNTLKKYVISAGKAGAKPPYFWIGLTDNNSDKGPWMWLGGSAVGTFKMFSGVNTSKNVAHKLDCGYVSTHDSNVKWRTTINCNSNKAIICQRDITVVTTPKPPPKINCMKGWTAYQAGKTCVKLFTQTKTWLDARFSCQSLGGDLVKMSTSGFGGFVNGLVSKQKGDYWIGLHDRHKENKFEWLDDDAISKNGYTNWASKEPNNYGGGENCVVLKGNSQNKWNDAACLTKYRYICQHAPGGNPKTTTATTVNPNCGFGWEHDPNTGNCYQFNTEVLAWQDAQLSCRFNGGDLATVTDVMEQFFLSGRAKGFDSDFFWIGANDRKTDGGWTWSDGSPFGFLNWDDGQPNNAHNSDCVVLVSLTGRWDDLPCNDRYGFICEKAGFDATQRPPQTTTPKSVPSGMMWGCPRGWRTNGGGCYQYTRNSGIDRPGAEADCVSKNSHLISISSNVEKNFALTLVPKGSKDKVWIGLSDESKFNSYLWSDRTPVIFTFWNKNEPNNLNKEDCVVMDPKNAKWESAKCTDKLKGYICKQSKSIQPKGGLPEQVGCSLNAVGYNALCYTFYESPKTFTDAQKYCAQKKGNLATSDDRHVQAFIGAEVFQRPSPYYWIGLSMTAATNNDYGWQSKSTVDFTYWDKSHTGNENNTCVGITSNRPAGMWMNFACDSKLPFLCESPRTGFTTPKPTTTTTTILPCPDGWSGRNNMCYKAFDVDIDKMLSWTDARDFCYNQADGGSLASILSRNDESWMRGSFLKGVTGIFWIGLNDRDSEGGYHWDDGSPFKYSRWSRGEPNDYANREDCVQWQLPANSWNDNYCYIASDFICQVPRGSIITTPKPTRNPPKSTLKCGNSSWVGYNQNCYFVSPIDDDMSTATWFEARQICADMSSSLVSIFGDDENGFLTSMIGAHPTDNFWIGLNDLNQKSYTWTDNSPVSYVSWMVNEPNDAYGGERCVEMNSDGLWNDNNCQQNMGYICKKPPGSATLAPTTTVGPIYGGCPPGFHSLPMLKMCFYVGGTTKDQKANFTEAIATCDLKTPFGRLASIHNTAEEKFITSLLADLKYPAWIGFNDLRQQKKFQWVDNLNIDFSNWGWQQPNRNVHDKSVDARRDCVDIEVNPKRAGDWYNKKCSRRLAYVCEAYKDIMYPEEDPNSEGCPVGYWRFKDSCYKYNSKKLTWSAAEQTCFDDGGHLASISDKMEQAFIELTTNSRKRTQMWLGLKFQTSTSSFAWSDNWPVTYTNWGHGEPEYSADYSCVTHTVDGTWQDMSCESSLFTFVCEVSLVLQPLPSQPPSIGSCPEGNWIEHQGYCYIIEKDNTKSWPGANYACNILGGNLASIHSNEEAQFVASVLFSFQTDAWIGLSKGQGGTGFAWSDQTGTEYLHWSDGEPSDPDSTMHQDCVKVNVQDGRWADTDCFDSNAYLCKTPISSSSGIPNQGGVTPYNPVTNPPYNPVTNPPYNPVTNPPYNPVTNRPYNPVTNAPYQPYTNPPYNPWNTPVNPGQQTQIPWVKDISQAPKLGNSGTGGGDKDSGLSGGAVAGIVIGCLAIVAISAAAIFISRGYFMAKIQSLSGKKSPLPAGGFDNAVYDREKGENISFSEA